MGIQRSVFVAVGAAAAGAGAAVAYATRRRGRGREPEMPLGEGPPAPMPDDVELAPDPGEDPQAALDAARARLRSRAERLARELDGGDDGREGPAEG